MWVADGADAELGLAWDWVDIGYGVVAMADPLAVVTNLRLVDGDEVLAPLESARHISGLVAALPWQAEVARALHRQAVQ